MVAGDVAELQLGAEEDRALRRTSMGCSDAKANGQRRCFSSERVLVAIELDVDIKTPVY